MKKFISILLCFSLSLLSMPFAFAANESIDPYAELKESVYNQLKAQNALGHYEFHIAALIPEESSIYASQAQRWYAPSGGVLSYQYDLKYQLDEGYVQNVVTFCDKEDTLKLMAGEFGTIKSVVLAVLGVVPEYIFSKLLLSAGIAQAYLDAYARKDIEDAGGYGKCSVIYDSISGGTSTVIAGWHTYPYAELNYSSAYDVSFEAA
ncbi:Uncharacterised protein [uncultured Butyricicoccus sp.]|uniref:Uncharacterized protein n=1 Tax=Agathobaculum ammoniilyticum TaxID=2981778 RepID=A0ABT2U768_9FIRM|nr:hypothetical protein [Agathobaculum ammoniilyticum]MCU6790458.1 hypothetical protein [Agathobaculum ammoniilyticum]SCJ63079.1 Uncharacterised protein [uncultured Butyricicoccus sp.]